MALIYAVSSGVWSDPNNWDFNPGGPGGDGPPTSSDTARIDSGLGTGTISADVNVDIAGLQVLGGALASTVDFNGFDAIIGFVQGFDSSPSLLMGEGTIEIAGNWDLQGNPVDWETSSLKMTGSSAILEVNTGTGANDFYNIEIDSAGTITYENGGTTIMNVANNFIVTSGTFTCIDPSESDISILNVDGDFLIDSNGTFICANLMDLQSAGHFTINSGGTYTHNTSTVTFDGTGNQDFTTDGEFFNSIDVDKNGGILEMQDNLILKFGGLHVIDGTMDFDDGVTAFNLTAESFEIESATTVNLNFGASIVTLDAGQFYSHTSPTINWHADSELIMNGVAQNYQCVSSTDAPPILIIDGSTVSFSLSGSDVGIVKTINGGVADIDTPTWIGVNAPTGSKILDLESSSDVTGTSSMWITSDGVTSSIDGFDNNSISLEIGGNNTSIVELSGNLNIEQLDIADTATFKCGTSSLTTAGVIELGRSTDNNGGKLYCGAAVVTIGTDLNMLAGSLPSPTSDLTVFMESATVYIAGDTFSNITNVATIDAGTSTLVLNGTVDQLIDLDGNANDLYNVTVTNISGTVFFEDGTNVNNIFAPGNPSGTVNIKFVDTEPHYWKSYDDSAAVGTGTVVFVSETPATQWDLTIGSNQTALHTNVTDSNLTGFTIDATAAGNVDGGNNTANWIFDVISTIKTLIPSWIFMPANAIGK